MMKISSNLPDWLRDPETIWVKVSVGLGLVILLLVTVCLQLRAEREACRDQIRELTALNNQQRKTIGQLGGELSQVRSAMSEMVTRMDELLSASKEQTELAAALLEETPEPPVREEAPAEPEAVAAAETETAVNTMSRTLTADFNRDGIVDWTDFEIFSQYWGKDGKLPVDLNHDREVTWKDFQIFAAEWMKTEPWYKEKHEG